MNDRLLEIIIRARDQASAVMAKVGSSMSGVRNQAQRLAQDGFGKIQAAGAAMVSGLAVGVPIIGAALGGIAVKAGMAQAQVQTMGVALETAMGGNIALAKEAQKSITEFATKTPYQLNEVMTAFVRLKNMGLDPSNKALTAYGDTASAMGKSLMEMVEAVADAATGEFERLKEFGIRASSQGDRVAFTFKGVTTTVGKNSKEIENYLINLGRTNFAGGMEKQSRTLAGLFSTLSDTINLKLAAAFDKLGGTQAATQAFEFLIKTIESIDIDAIITRIGDAFAYVRDEAEKLWTQFTQQPIYVELQKLWEQADKVLILQSALAGLGAILAVLAVSAVISLGTVAVAAVAATWPFIALGAAVALLYAAWQTNFMGIQQLTAQLWAQIQPVFQQIMGELEPLRIELMALWQTVSPVLIPALQMLAAILAGVVYVAIILIAQTVLALVQTVRSGVRMITDVWNNLSLVFRGVAQVFSSLVRGDMGGALQGLGMIATGVFNSIVSLARFAFNQIRFPANALIRTYNQANDAFGGRDLPEIPGFARGTMFAPGGLAMVGENGPELVTLPRGSRVNTAARTQDIMSNQTSGLTINIDASGAVFADDRSVDDFVRGRLLNSLKKYGIA